MKRFEKVTAADIKRLANEILTLDSFALAAIGPYKTDAELLDYIKFGR